MKFTLLVTFFLSSSCFYTNADEDREVKPHLRTPSPDTILPTRESEEDDDTDQGMEDQKDEDLPLGFEVLDGVVMDITNLVVQTSQGGVVEYKKYQPATQSNGEVLYRRPSREEGWHFILFEDPEEETGTGHLILLQKMLGFSVEGKNIGKEVRLYEIFHVDLGADMVEMENEIMDNEASAEKNTPPDPETDPNKSAEFAPVAAPAGPPGSPEKE